VRAITRYKEIVVHGHAAEQVLALADQIDADLVVIGAQHKRFADATASVRRRKRSRDSRSGR
jgi:nucleotide-binding universal stress UspA family protein